ncbi:MAG TPA: hypothetical protein DEA96_11190 [Leptospiraceae bacterium]|nr:hypothetical protein [Spirochaetaceae bacterium]HBS05524.1 hypothetical protein [Leptospiraceae bacterium]
MIPGKKTVISLLLIFALQPVFSEPSSGSNHILELSTGLSGNPPETREGYFTLEWELLSSAQLHKITENNPGDRLVLLESRDSRMDEPTVFHDDQSMSLAMSGKVDGDLYYQIFFLRQSSEMTENAVPPPPELSQDAQALLAQYSDYELLGYSNVLHVRVNHYSLSTALIYFGIGAFLFLITTAVIIIGTYRSPREEK